MSRIRVALGDVQSPMLRDILEQITDLEPGMELVGYVNQPDLKQALANQQADVVICDIRPEDLPEVWRGLFADGRAPVLVGLARDGRQAAICIANAGPAQLMSVVRSAMPGADAHAKVVELGRHPESEREGALALPYLSNSECLNDQFRCLDLALLAEVDAFESTVWDEGTQRLQGLAISPDEVRTLLQAGTPAPAPRQSGELRRRRARLQALASARIAVSLGRPDAPPFVRLIERFRLGSFEQFLIVATLAVEIDRNKYGKAYALLQDDVTRKHPSLELLLRLHGGVEDRDRWEAAKALDVSRPLSRWRLVRLGPREQGDPSTPFGRRIELDDRISRFVLSLSDLGAQLEEFVTIGGWESDMLRVPPDAEMEERLERLIDQVRRGAPGAPPRLAVHVHGRPGSGRRSLVAAICQRSGLRLLRVDAGRLAAAPQAVFDDSLLMIARESTVEPTALCLENIEGLLEDEGPSPQHGLRGIVQALGPLTFLVGQRAWSTEDMFDDGMFQSVTLDLPDAAGARRLWDEALAEARISLDGETTGTAARELSSRFRLSAGQIHNAVATAQTRALWEKPEGAALTLADLYRACREQCGHRLGTLTRQVATEFGWDDLVLPDKPRNQLRELETAIKNATGVMQDWNFQSRLPYGRGITALFSGPSGTGKTMAAGILAHELGLDLYKIDLSRVVSKYIGETEKNLDRIFRQAEDANAMLFFDEADALFGKRSAIKDAHDRYANIEIAYLLQKMEERLGVTILASNLKTNMDDAFLRRIRFGIEFPMPEYAQRLEIWHTSLPKGIRLADDVDLSVFARRLRVSGGSIMNVCVSAASIAYEPGGAIRMEHFAHAAKRELQKLGHQYNESDFAPSAAGVALPESAA